MPNPYKAEEGQSPTDTQEPDTIAFLRALAEYLAKNGKSMTSSRLTATIDVMYELQATVYALQDEIQLRHQDHIKQMAENLAVSLHRDIEAHTKRGEPAPVVDRVALYYKKEPSET